MEAPHSCAADRWIAGGLVLAMAGALALRLPALDRRPMHGDEAVHADKLHTLWESGSYVYDPNEYHGPTLYYLTHPILKLAGCRSYAEFSERQLRLIPVLAGAALVPLLWLVRDGLGRRALPGAALLTATSTAMSFYSRYYIQETLLVFFTLWMLAAGWRYHRSGKILWAAAAGVGAGLMHATKETSVIAFGCAAAAWCVARGLGGRPIPAPNPAAMLSSGHAQTALERSPRRHWPGLVAAVAAAATVSILMYSAFLRNPRGPLDSLLTYRTYFDRAGNFGLHDHPWWMYLHILLFTRWAPGPWWSEALIVLLAIVGGLAAWRRGGRTSGFSADAADPVFLRFLMIYTLLMVATYSAIPYKTPWCMLGFLHGMILLAGVGIGAGLRAARSRIAQALVLMAFGAGLGHLIWQTTRADGRFCADNRNPYVYAHPVRDVVRLATFIDRVAASTPDEASPVIQVICPEADYWPLPWYLRKFRVGYWSDPPATINADVLIVQFSAWPEVEKRLPREYQMSFYGLRPDVPLVVAVDRERWSKFVTQIQEATHPGTAAAGG